MEMDALVEDLGPSKGSLLHSFMAGTMLTLYHLLIWLLVLLGAVLIGAAIWVRQTFGTVIVDQILLNLPGAAGAEGTGIGQEYVESFIWLAIFIPLVAVLALGAIILIIWGLVLLARRRRILISGSGAILDEEKRPRKPRTAIRRSVQAVAAIAVFAVGVVSFSETVSLWQYIRSITASVSMADYYVTPGGRDDYLPVDTQEERDPDLRNLVMIYLESTEDAFADEEVFGANLLEPLTEATSGWDTVPSLLTYWGGGWTMAGLVGTQCGVPLRGAEFSKTDINSNEIGAGNADYLAGAVCLGDVLAGIGYRNVFMGGADLEFAAKGNFFASHGYEDIRGYSDWEMLRQSRELADEDFGPWGLSDRALMEQAKQEVTRLHESGEPFNLTLLTLDTHEPVHLYEHCPESLGPGLESVIRCSAGNVADFIEYLQSMGYLDDTVVILVGDHPKMLGEGGALWEEMKDIEDTDRTIFNRIWSPDGVEVARPNSDQLSLYATMLELLGLGREDGRAGVGVSLLREGSSDDAILALSAFEYEELLRSRSSDLYRQLWGIEDVIDAQSQGAG
ncbi:MAG: sulfatase-like hydrolase/transferase [Leucobacter sp.]